MNGRNKSPDNLDMKILSELQKNARTSASEIGRRVGLSTPAVSERIAKMEEQGVILGYHANVNYDKLGLAVKVFIHFTSESLKHADMVKMVAKIPQAKEWYTVTGDACMLIKVIVGSTHELEHVIEHLGKFGSTKTTIILSGKSEYGTLN